VIGPAVVLAIVAEWRSMSSDRLIAAADLAVGLVVVASGAIVVSCRVVARR
jgi:hypothetical protein